MKQEMTNQDLKEAFANECTTTDSEGRTVVKGTPMDVIIWIDNYIKSLTYPKAISDEEIHNQDLEKSKEFSKLSHNQKVFVTSGFRAGAKWMREQLQSLPLKGINKGSDETTKM